MGNKKIIITISIVVVLAICFLVYQILFNTDLNTHKSDGGDGENMVGNGINGIGWTEMDGAKYYLDQDGHNLTGEQLIGDKVYYFNDSGKWDEAEPLDAVIITVQQSNNASIYRSLTGGKTWLNNETPVYYMTMEVTSYPRNIGEVTVTLYNNSETPLITSTGFSLLIWGGDDWVSSPADGLYHNDEGYKVQPNGSLEMNCNFQNKTLEDGRYKLIKEVWQPDDKSVKLSFSVEFVLT